MQCREIQSRSLHTRGWVSTLIRLSGDGCKLIDICNENIPYNREMFFGSVVERYGNIEVEGSNPSRTYL